MRRCMGEGDGLGACDLILRRFRDSRSVIAQLGGAALVFRKVSDLNKEVRIQLSHLRLAARASFLVFGEAVVVC